MLLPPTPYPNYRHTTYKPIQHPSFLPTPSLTATPRKVCLWLNGHRPPAKSALQKMARGGEGGSARRENKPYITGAEAKVYATLKSDTIMVIVVYTDSHAD